MHMQWFGNVPKSKETTSKGIRFINVQNPQKLGLEHVQHVYTTTMS
jgi:hypothetical protein